VQNILKAIECLPSIVFFYKFCKTVVFLHNNVNCFDYCHRLCGNTISKVK